MKNTLLKLLVTQFESENCYLDHCCESTDCFHVRTSVILILSSINSVFVEVQVLC